MQGVMKKWTETVNRASFFVLSIVSERSKLWHCLIVFLLSSSSMIFIATVSALVAIQISQFVLSLFAHVVHIALILL